MGVLNNFLKAFKGKAKGPVLVLDIGSSYVKLAYFSLRGKEYILEAFEMDKLPPEVIVGKEVMDRQTLVDKIRDLYSKIAPETNKVILNVSGGDVIVKKITVPKAKKKEQLEESILWKMREEIPFDPNEVSWSYFVLGESSVPDSVDLILATAKLDLIYGIIDLVRAAGLEPLGISVDPVAAYFALKENQFFQEEGIQLVAHVGYENTVLLIVEDGKFLFSRDVPVSIKTYIDSMSRFLDISPEEAEEVLFKGPGEKVDHDAYQDTMASLHDRFVGNLERYFQGAIPEEKSITKWYLSGGGAFIMGLSEFLEERFKTSTEIVDPLGIVNTEAVPHVQEIAPLMTVEIGLMLQYYMKEPTINLIPVEEAIALEEVPILPHIIVSLSILFLLIIVSLVVSISISRKISKLNKEIISLKKEKVELQKKANEIKGFKKQIEETQKKIDVIKELSNGRDDYVRLLDEINRIVPSNVWLKSVTRNGKYLKIAGTGSSNLKVAEFMRNLRNSPMVDSLQLIGINVNIFEERKVADFEIQVKIKENRG